MASVIIEGVEHRRFRVAFRTKDGRRHRWIRWSPGRAWIGEEVKRELTERGFKPNDIRGKIIVTGPKD